MKTKSLVISLTAAGVLAAAGYALYALGLHRGMSAAASTALSAATGSSGIGTGSAAPAATTLAAAANESGEDATRRHMAAGLKAGDVDPFNGRKILYYHDPMVLANKFDKPAKSPFMDMMMSPVYAQGDADQGTVTVSPRVQQNLGVRTAEVTEGTLSPQVSAVGSIAFDERDQATLQARATGYVEHLNVRATLDTVAKGQPLVDLYVPDWIAAQEEFLSIRRMQGTDLAGLVDGARQRMRQAGMSDAQIALVERSGKTQPRITLAAPIGGVVVELLVREGMTVMPGATLFRINGLSTVWANAEVPESLAALLRPGAKVQARSPAVPGTTFDGRLQAILPEVNSSTRTLKARLELANPGGRLVPGMFVQMNFVGTSPDRSLLIPTEAVIQTGRRTVVMVAEDGGHFRPVEVEAGIESGGRTEIKQGLKVGQRVVVSSQFLIDSESSLKGIEARLNGAPPPDSGAGAGATAVAAPLHQGEGEVEAIGSDTVTLSHGAIASMKWGPMTMDFKQPSPAARPPRLKNGDRVAFEFYMDAEGTPQLTRVTPLGHDAGAASRAAPSRGSR